MKRTRLDASAPIEQVNFALAAAVLGELRRKGVSGRFGEPVGAALLDGDTRLAARLPGRMERFDVEIGPRRLPVVMDGAHVPFNIGAVLRDLALTPDLSGPCVAIVALAADKDAQGFVRRTRRARLDRAFHRSAGIKPGPLTGRIAGACDFAWARERGRAGRKTSAQARSRTGSPRQRLAAYHRLALSHRGAQRRGRRGGPNAGRSRRRAGLGPASVRGHGGSG